MVAFRRLLNRNTKLLSVVWISNALGTINPVEEMIAAAHALDVLRAALAEGCGLQITPAKAQVWSPTQVRPPNLTPSNPPKPSG